MKKRMALLVAVLLVAGNLVQADEETGYLLLYGAAAPMLTVGICSMASPDWFGGSPTAYIIGGGCVLGGLGFLIWGIDELMEDDYYAALNNNALIRHVRLDILPTGTFVGAHFSY
jgi:hypothetical protein